MNPDHISKADAKLRWASSAWAEMLAHCDKEKPREACGALLGRPGHVDAVAPMKNVEEGLDHYRIDPAEVLALFEACDEQVGKDPTVEVLGWYHSHPRTSARPSDLDLDLAVPGFFYVIVGIDRVCTFSI